MKITIEIDEGKCAISTDADNKYNRDPSEVEAEDDHHKCSEITEDVMEWLAN